MEDEREKHEKQGSLEMQRCAHRLPRFVEDVVEPLSDIEVKARDI